MVGLILIGLGVGKLGFVADLLSKEVQVGYMNGLAITIIVGQLPKLCGFSTDADGFVDEVADVLHRPRRAQHDRARARPRHAGGPARAAAVHQEDPGGAGRGGRRHRRDRAVRSRTSPTVGCASAGAAAAGAAVDRARATSAPMLVAALGITLVSLTDTIATVDRVRRPPGRRGRPEPGDDRHRHGQHRGRVLPGLRRLDQRVAHRGGRAVGRQEPAHRARRRVSSSRCCCCSSARCSPTCRRRRWRPS